MSPALILAEAGDVTLPLDSGQAFIALLIVLKTLIDFIAQRAARRDLEADRAFQAKERESVARKVEDTARSLAINTKEIKEAVAENTALTAEAGLKADAAYKEANNVNVKIEAVGGVRRTPPPGTERRGG